MRTLLLNKVERGVNNEVEAQLVVRAERTNVEGVVVLGEHRRTDDRHVYVLVEGCLQVVLLALSWLAL